MLNHTKLRSAQTRLTLKQKVKSVVVVKNHGLKKVVVVLVLVVEEVLYGLAVVLHSVLKLTEIMI